MLQKKLVTLYTWHAEAKEELVFRKSVWMHYTKHKLKLTNADWSHFAIKHLLFPI